MEFVDAVAVAAAMLVEVGGPEAVATVTVITVEAAAAVVIPDAVSVAVIVTVAPLLAPAATVTRPSALTVATVVLDEEKVSLEALKVWVVPLL